jgi:hypothetical protein
MSGAPGLEGAGFRRVTIPGHLTIYRYQPEGISEHGARSFGRLAGMQRGFDAPSSSVPLGAPPQERTDAADRF